MDEAHLNDKFRYGDLEFKVFNDNPDNVWIYTEDKNVTLMLTRQDLDNVSTHL